MTNIHVNDENSGELVTVNIESPAGTIYVKDASTGKLVSLNISDPEGVVKAIDSDTGNFIDIDYSNPSGILTVIDPNTGEFVDIDLANPKGTLFCLDENTGEFIEVNLGTANFYSPKGLIGKPRFSNRMLSFFGTSSISAYYPLKEETGSVATDVVNAKNGSYSGVTLANKAGIDGSMPFFDGTNDYVNISAMSSLFTPLKGSIMVKAQVSASSVWTDGATRVIARLLADGNNFVDILKPTSNNQLQFRFRAGGGTTASVTASITPTTNLFSVGITWERGSVNLMKAFYNGVQIGTSQSIAGIWSGAPAATTSCLGAATTAPTSPWKGWLGHAVFANRVATDDEMLAYHGGT